MYVSFVRVALVLWLSVGFTLASADTPPEFFEAQVQPLLVDRCLSCHGADHKGGLDLRQRQTALAGGENGPVIEAGEPDSSPLLDYVESQEMPPGHPLTGDEVAVLRRWISEGAYFPPQPINPFAVTTGKRAGFDWWALKPLSEPAAPKLDSELDAWSEQPLDRFIAAQLAAKGLRPSPPADRRTLIRRVTYDLTGLPPTYEEVQAFVNDERPDAYERLVDQLLASPRYGEQWGRHWLDVVRFGESNGFERNQIIDNAWPFRDYVIRSFNEDKPFDQLVREHLVGDLLAPGDPAVAVGTTFLVCGPYDDVGNQDPVQAAQIRANTVDDMIRAVSETFLGLTVGCARCHDHKFDPITQRDYYSLYATLAGVYHGSRQLGTAAQHQERAEQERVLQERRSQLTQMKSAIDDAALARGEQHADELAKSWRRPPAARRGTEELFAPIAAQYVRLVVEGLDTDPMARSGYRIDEFEVWTSGAPPRNVALASSGAKAEGPSPVAEDFAAAYSADLAIDGQYGAPWIAAGPELIISLAEPATISRVFFSSDRSGSAGDQPVATFISDYRIEVSLDKMQWTVVASSADRQSVNPAHRRKRLLQHELTESDRQQLTNIQDELAIVNRHLAELPALPNWWVGEFRAAPGPFHVFVGGSPERPGDAVTATSLGALASTADGYQLQAEAAESDRRRALADWLVHSDNSLTPRVLANRLWHYHFGTGIVATPSDFGFMGGRPTHPELLDWLACQLRKSGWRLKPVHRQIVLSRTYQQASTWDAASAQIDADSRYLWRFPPRRLTAEEFRDTLLQSAGKLDLRMGGPGFRLYRYLQDNVATYVPLDQFGPETYRRAVYHQNARAMRIDLMTDFDGPDCAFAAPRRDATTTPLQALTLLNHQFTLDMSDALAEQILSDVRSRQTSGGIQQPEPAACVERAFERVLTRKPVDEERIAGTNLIQSHGLPAFCRALLNANELLYCD